MLGHVMKRYPGERQYQRGARRAFARLRYARVVREHAEDSPVVRAALGRMLYHGGDGYEASVLQPDDDTIESIAWHRESGAQPGFMNRAMRKAFK